jgi:alkylation response protein AidB-like acyl-CoA dehydrogenase
VHLHSFSPTKEEIRVDLELSADQELLRETTYKFLTATWPTSALRELMDGPLGFDRDIWAQGAELGWTSLLVPERFGGGNVSGEGVCDLGIIAEELGRFLVAGPVLPTNIVAYALARKGSDEMAELHLPAIVTGREIATWAVAEEGDGWAAEAGAVQARGDHKGYRLTGVKTPVQDAHVADYFLVVAATSDGMTQFMVPADSPGLMVELLDGLDLSRRFGRVRFTDVEVSPDAVVGDVGEAGADVESQTALALALQCSETVGATDRMYEVLLEYVRDRKSFGRPIGSYQAIKHRLVDMLLWLESAKAATVACLKAVESEVDATSMARVAKSYVADRCPVILRECLQLHGGIGYTWEHDLHLYLRRVETNAAIYGGADYHRDRLATTIGL